MSEEILTAILSCSGSQPGTLGYRTLSFIPTVREFIEIGRSSKREAKNLTPACDNAWFDSRVMSRHHARLWVSFENRALYICDGGSMHGTWVNEMKIMPDQDVQLHNDDVITFGNDVTRGAETFPPLKVTCQYGFQPSAPIPDMIHSMNTFIVPDDDENDIVDVADSAPVNDGDGLSEDSDMGHSTPITSPSNKEIPSESASKAVNTLLEVIENSDSSNGPSRSPILLDNEEPLVTPRMTPPSVLNTMGKPQDNTADDVDDEDDAQSMPRSPVEDYMNDIEIEYSDEEEDGDDQDMSDEDDSEAASSDEIASDDEKSEVDGPSGEPPLAHDVHLSTTADEKKNQSFDATGSILQQPTTDLHTQESPNPSSFESVWPLSRPEAAVAPSTTTRLPSLFALSSNGWNHQDLPGGVYSGEQSKLQSQSRYSPYEPRDCYHHANDVPPVHECAPTSENPWTKALQLAESNYQEPSNVPATSTSNEPPADREHKTRVSIADILDTQTAQGAASKRKASEMMSDEDLSYPDSAGIYTFDANPTPLEVDTTSKETYSQDAQPQPSLSHYDSSTQVTGIHTIEETAPAPKEERPSKRVKASEGVRVEAPQARHGRGFVSHTATAIAGALIGSVGTVALLASLPPDFFA